MPKENIHTDCNLKTIESVLYELKSIGFKVIVGTPCSMLEGLIAHPFVNKNFQCIMATNEGEAVAIAVGAAIADQKAVVFSQNSGLGNMVNPITSLSNTFKIPLLFIISWRGNTVKKDAPQHQFMGEITHDLLKLLKIKTLKFPKTRDDISNTTKNIMERFKARLSTCLIVDETLEQCNKTLYEPKITKRHQTILAEKSIQSFHLTSRYNTIEKITKILPKDCIYISTTGETGRELSQIADRKNNFYMVGSMGYASSIGLGISLFINNKVVVLDGDGAVLMHMGNLATIGTYASNNLLHIVLNNNTYSSTGGQYNSSVNISFTGIAQACNYATIAKTDDNNLANTLKKLMDFNGPCFLEILIDNCSTSIKANRPCIGPSENAIRLKNYLKEQN